MLITIFNYLENITENKYLYLLILTIIIYISIKLIEKITYRIYAYIKSDSKARYMYKKRLEFLGAIIFILITFFIWEPYLKSIITLVSFISAGTTIALREIIFNFFSGIYIKVRKPFQLEDRIEISDYLGDVVNIANLSFEILEVGKEINGEQSTGKIVHLPNSLIFTTPLKNFAKAFKYIWTEITVKIPLDSDLKKTKSILYEIVKNNQVVERIPQKMKKQLTNSSLDYRIYYNKFEPIIYTRVVDTHVELYVRYLIHPKKMRYVEDEIWTKILNAYNKKEIILYKE